MGKHSSSISLFITLLIISSMWPFAGAEDVSNARNNILNGNRLDFWGGFSQFFYSLFHLKEPLWNITLGLIHALLILIGTWLVLIDFKKFNPSSNKILLLLLLHYFAMNFSLNLSRDGSLLAFLWIGIALTFTSRSNSRLSYYGFGSGILLIIIGLSFRPWLSLAFIPIVLAIIKNLERSTYRLGGSWRKYILSLLILIGPLLLDTSAKSLMNLQKSFPEQQVIIHDLASISCMSANKSTQNAAIAALEPISPDPFLSREKLCGQFYPQNWASVVFYSNPEKPAITIINATQGETYRLVRDSWLSIILSNPTEYMGIKMIQLSQLFFAGDSATPLFDQPRRFFSLPYEIFKNLRIFSFLPSLLFFSFITFSCRDKGTFIFRFNVLSSYVSASFLIVIAFIGDNQRYISWLAIIIAYAYLLRPFTHKIKLNHE